MSVTRPVDDAREESGDIASHGELVGAGLWLVSSFVILSLANYIFSLVMSRTLSVEDYGSFGVISSIFLLEGLVATAGFPWILTAFVSRNDGGGQRLARGQALSVALLGNGILGLLTAGGVALASASLVAHHPLVPVIAGLTALATCVNAVWYGLFQGERRFPLLALLRSGEAGIKVVLGTALVVAGLGLNGAVAGTAIAACCMLAWGATKVRAFAWPRRRSWAQTQTLKVVGWTILAQLGLALLMNMDILAVRALGNGANASQGAGYYQAATVLARAPVLVGVAVLSAGFPFLARSAASLDHEQKCIRMMVRALALGPLPIAVILFAAPQSAIGFFFPPSYAPAVTLLRLTSLAVFPLVAVATVVTSLQAVDAMKRAASAIVPAVALEAILLVVLVPRAGAEGAAWSALAGACLGLLAALVLAPRRWWTPALSQLPPAACAWAIVAGLAIAVPVLSKLWIVEVLALYALFLLIVWLLGGLSLSEIQPFVPSFARGLVGRLAALEGGGRMT